MALYPILYGSVPNLIWLCTQSYMALYPILYGSEPNLIWLCTQSYMALYPILYGTVPNIIWLCTQSYMALYPILYRAVPNPQECSLAYLFNQMPSRLLREAAINARRLFVQKYPSLTILRYSFIQPSELEQCRVKQLAQGLTQQHRIQTQVVLVEFDALCTAPILT